MLLTRLGSDLIKSVLNMKQRGITDSFLTFIAIFATISVANSFSVDEKSGFSQDKLYPFHDGESDGQQSDLIIHAKSYTNQVKQQLNFSLPFFGFSFNYTWISVHGYLGFRDAAFPSPSLQFPVPTWPNDKDPSFISPFYNYGRIKSRENDTDDPRTPGIYFRVERELTSNGQRVVRDIRNGIVGAENFIPKHIVITTWKDILFDWTSTSLEKGNTFQVVLATDEIRTYAIFNYNQLDNVTNAFIGFNAGEGRKSYEYQPYSRNNLKKQLLLSNGNIGGRHVFRIDENVISGSCRQEPSNDVQPLVFAPESGQWMGGMVVNVTGPCFNPNQDIICRFDSQTVIGKYIDQHRTMCIMPRIHTSGYIDLSVSINGGADFNWKGRFFVESRWVEFDTVNHHQLDLKEFRMSWDRNLLSTDENAKVRITLWGYRGDSLHPDIEFIDTLKDGAVNNGSVKIRLSELADRDNGPHLQQYNFGLIQVNLTTFDPAIKIGPSLWTRPLPLGWYFNQQWKRFGNDTIHQRCQQWIKVDDEMRQLIVNSAICPCLMQQAASDKGQYIPVIDCSKDSNALCYYNQNVSMCYHAGISSKLGDSQHCCYGENGHLLTTSRGNPTYFQHHFKDDLLNNEIPSVFFWQMDVVPYYTCCTWQSHDKNRGDCEQFLASQRSSEEDCIGYQAPGVAAVFGDPHFYTFDNLSYTFNGKGEFVLVRADSDQLKLDIQARFESIDLNQSGRATVLAAIVARENDSALIEVRIRPPQAQSKYRLDILIDQNFIYFDTQHFQHFKGAMVYTPTSITNQSHVIIMFHSGIGVEVIENNRHMSARVYLPPRFMNQTRGLFGNWSNDITDDLILPDGNAGPSIDINNLENLHQNFGIKWLVNDQFDDPHKGKSLFYHENGRSSNFYNNETFQPIFDIKPLLMNNTNVSQKELERACGNSYQCYYDYSVSFDLEYGSYSKHYLEEIMAIKNGNQINPGIQYEKRQEKEESSPYVADCFPDGCLNGGICRTDASGCICPPGYSGVGCEEDLIVANVAEYSTSKRSSPAVKELTSSEVEKLTGKISTMVEDALIHPHVTKEFFSILSNLMEANDKILKSSPQSSSEIIDSIDRYTRHVPLTLDQPVVMTTPNIAVETVLVNAKRNSYSFRPLFEGDSTVPSVSLTVPKEAFQNSHGNVRLRFVSYRNGKLFQSRNKRLSGQPTLVLSISIGDHPVSGLNVPLTFTIPISNSSSFYSCVYWDEIVKDWSTRGIKTRKTDNGMIECSSDHLTAFTVLFDPTPTVHLSGFHETVLGIISYIGSGLSIIGLSITVFLYASFKILRRDRAGKIHLNLSISLLLLNIVFLTGSIIGHTFTNVDLKDPTESLDPNRIWVGLEPTVSQSRINFCTGLTISVHYLVLSSLTWMLVEAIHMYQMLILVFTNTETYFMLKRMIAAWGAPLVVVITSAALHLDHYRDPSGETCGQMSEVHPIIYYGAFFGPVCFILVVNTAVFVMVLRIILQQGKRGRAVGKVAAAAETANGNGGTNRPVIMGQLRGAVTVMALLGVTWIAGALAIGPIKILMSYVFCICNSLQGFVIFIVRVVQYPEARKSFVGLWSSKRTNVAITKDSSGQTMSTSDAASRPESKSLIRSSKRSSRVARSYTPPSGMELNLRNNAAQATGTEEFIALSNSLAPPEKPESTLAMESTASARMADNQDEDFIDNLLPTEPIIREPEDRIEDQPARESIWVLYF